MVFGPFSASFSKQTSITSYTSNTGASRPLFTKGRAVTKIISGVDIYIRKTTHQNKGAFYVKLWG